MKAIFNNEIKEWDDIRLSPDNRGWKYGDGFFETIALLDGKPRLLDKHLERLGAATKLLRIESSDLLDFDRIYNHIITLVEIFGIGTDGKARIYVWRNASGTYCPTGNGADILISVDKHSFIKRIADNVGFSKIVINYPSMTSRFKTLNSMQYVLCGIEKEERGLDDIILLDVEGHVSETLTSNIFWKVGDTYFTPPLSTGCVEGIMRNYLIAALRKHGIEVCEKLVTSRILSNAEIVFSCNALGITYIRSIENTYFELEENIQPIIDAIR